jgi:uncharacterized alkaline shock family protein YloU
VDRKAVVAEDVLASYAADAAREIEGVACVLDGSLPHRRGAQVSVTDCGAGVEIHLGIDWGVDAVEVGTTVQARVAEYLVQMAGFSRVTVGVVIGQIGPARGSTTG